MNMTRTKTETKFVPLRDLQMKARAGHARYESFYILVYKRSSVYVDK
jgi:hypothetical protein